MKYPCSFLFKMDAEIRSKLLDLADHYQLSQSEVLRCLILQEFATLDNEK